MRLEGDLQENLNLPDVWKILSLIKLFLRFVLFNEKMLIKMYTEFFQSHLDHKLHDHFNAEIVTRTIENKQDAVMDIIIQKADAES